MYFEKHYASFHNINTVWAVMLNSNCLLRTEFIWFFNFLANTHQMFVKMYVLQVVCNRHLLLHTLNRHRTIW